MARLSVNLNKIALLRNSRRTGVPDLRRFAVLALESGAKGLTIHPRPDERHIRGMLQILRDSRPEQATLVPDAPDAFTSEEGWKLDSQQMALAVPAIVAMKALGCRVVLFIDPDPDVIQRARAAGADGVEIYTGGYAAAFRHRQHAPILAQIAATAAAAVKAGLVVNAGHDLNLLNIPPLMQAVPSLAEASIGHELTADALEMGFAATVAAYARALGQPVTPLSS